MAEITLKQVSKTYDNGTKALKSVDLVAEDHEFLVLLGPSGCGKSTMLRVIAGLEVATEGEVLFDGQDVSPLPARERNVSMVFQNFALYPHLNVYKNIAFPLKSRKMKQDEIKKRVEETARILDIEHVLNRRPKHLSGGQRQRVALGRAMVRQPVVFLLDEPLSNLDVKMRVELRDEIVKLHKTLQTTFIYVTHDQAEAMHMGSRVVVMNEGEIIQTGTPQQVYNYPDNMFVAGFVGSPKMNFFPSRIRKAADGWEVLLFGNAVKIPVERLPLDTPRIDDGMKVILGIRPEEFKSEQSASAIEVEATAQKALPMGAGLHVDATNGNQKFLTVLMNHTDVTPGEKLTLHVDPWCIHVFDAETEQNLCKAVYKEVQA